MSIISRLKRSGAPKFSGSVDYADALSFCINKYQQTVGLVGDPALFTIDSQMPPSL
jgi:hypothetical protein